jgi:hypothetical protein
MPFRPSSARLWQFGAGLRRWPCNRFASHIRQSPPDHLTRKTGPMMSLRHAPRGTDQGLADIAFALQGSELASQGGGVILISWCL